jgi:hypothetical protein
MLITATVLSLQPIILVFVMLKNKGVSAVSAVELENRRREKVRENPPSPSADKDVNKANALKWHSWGWSKVDAYTKAGVSKKSFKRSGISQDIIYQLFVIAILRYSIYNTHIEVPNPISTMVGVGFS